MIRKAFNPARLLAVLIVAQISSMSSAQTNRTDFPLPTSVFGSGTALNSHFMTATPDEYTFIKNGGFKWLREDIVWTLVEKTKGVIDLTPYDRIMSQAQTFGMRQVVILGYSNPLYTTGVPRDAQSIAAYANFVKAVVSKYKGRGIIWEIWNEPDGGTFWDNAPDPDEYMNLAIPAVQAIRSVAPDEWVSMPDTSRIMESQIKIDFLTGCFKRGLLNYADVISTHGYRWTAPETIGTEYRQLRQMIARYNTTGKVFPLVCTEWNYNWLRHGLDDATIGNYAQRTFLSNIMSNVNLQCWYDYKDLSSNQADVQAWTGLVSYTGAVRNTYYQIKFITDELTGYKFVGRLQLPASDDYCLLFSNGTDQKLVAYSSTAASHAANLPASAGTFTWETAAGSGTVTGTASGIPMTLTGAPVVLTPQAPNRLLSTASQMTLLPLDANVDSSVDGGNLLQPVLDGFRQLNLPSAATLKLDDASVYASNPFVQSTTWTGTSLTPLRSSLESVSNLTLPMYFVKDHSGNDRTLTMTLSIPGEPPLVQVCTITKSKPLDIVMMPQMGQRAIVRMLNNSGAAFNGTLRYRSGSKSEDLLFTLKEGQKFVDLTLQSSNSFVTQRDFTLDVQDPSINGTINQQLVLSTPILHQSLPLNFSEYLIAGLIPIMDWTTMIGDSTKLGSTFLTSIDASPAGLSITGTNSMKITYNFASNCNYARVIPSILKSPMLPGLWYTTMWVYGDNSGHELKVRVIDITGQTLTYTTGTVNWTGWKLVKVMYDAKAVGFWGGANDGFIHGIASVASPILIDVGTNPSLRSGQLYVTGITSTYRP